MKLYRYSTKLFGIERKGIVLQSKTDSWGEAAPYPGPSHETFEQALEQLRGGLFKGALLPSVSFAFDSAFNDNAKDSIILPMAGLLIGSKNEILSKAQKSHGFTHMKLKISNLSPEEAHEVVQSLYKNFRLRIDLNRKWTLEQSLEFFKHYPVDAFDYIEEPASNTADLEHFSHPFALDETLKEKDPESFLHMPNLKAFVFKPTILGMEILKRLIPLNKPIILSSCYESGIGIFNIASLIKKYSLDVHPLGVDTYRFLEEDLLEEPLKVQQGAIHIPKQIRPKRSLLHAI